RLAAGAGAGRELEGRTDAAHQVSGPAIAEGGQGEALRLGPVRHPGHGEVMLQHRDPATGDVQVQRAVVDEVLELALLELLRRAVPGGADEAVPLGVGEAETVAGLRRRDALQLQVTVTAPGQFAFVADLLADGDGVAAAL